mmetsp:Transcript_28236/g.50960  ORF Transcript_28236/g.50960 Transcript_28236/m.50960 type:complete len:85 (+) Transcript_28236:118-372(+)
MYNGVNRPPITLNGVDCTLEKVVLCIWNCINGDFVTMLDPPLGGSAPPELPYTVATPCIQATGPSSWRVLSSHRSVALHGPHRI